MSLLARGTPRLPNRGSGDEAIVPEEGRFPRPGSPQGESAAQAQAREGKLPAQDADAAAGGAVVGRALG